MADLIADLAADLLAFETSRPRAMQVETGASQVGGCRAETVFRLRGTPQSDPRISWQAWVGNAIHERLATVRGSNPRYLCEQRFTYRGIPATVDSVDLEAKIVVDFKSKDSVDDFPDAPKPEWLTQVNLGAAGANAAGVEVTHVAVIVLPRAGEFTAQQFGRYPVDIALADAAVDWVEETNRIARVPDDVLDDMLDLTELRDEPPMFCARYCPYVTTCRGVPDPPQPLDDDVAAVAAEYDAARTERDRAKARMEQARGSLVGLKGQAGEWRITTSGGREKTEQVEDTDQIRDWWTFVNGDLPTVERTTRTNISLTVKRATVKGKS